MLYSVGKLILSGLRIWTGSILEILGGHFMDQNVKGGKKRKMRNFNPEKWLVSL